MITHSELVVAERTLRKDDRALRLRLSAEGPNVLVERKTFRGQVGSHGPDGLVWRPDAGRRREEGHVPVCSLPRDGFDVADLRQALREADSWRRWDQSSSRIREMEAYDEYRKKKQILDRKDGMRYRAGNIYDRYAWATKSRVSMQGAYR